MAVTLNPEGCSRDGYCHSAWLGRWGNQSARSDPGAERLLQRDMGSTACRGLAFKLAEGPVSSKPVLWPKIPANREINRESSKLGLIQRFRAVKNLPCAYRLQAYSLRTLNREFFVLNRANSGANREYEK